MQEIRVIRKRLRNAKNMSPEERGALTRREAQGVKKYGLEVKLPEHVLVKKVK
jgi:hypothetical protein